MVFCYAKLLVQNTHKWLKRIEKPAANLERRGNTKNQRRHRRRWFQYPGWDSNPHGLEGHWILSPARLPIPPPGHLFADAKLQKIYFFCKDSGVIFSIKIFASK